MLSLKVYLFWSIKYININIYFLWNEIYTCNNNNSNKVSPTYLHPILLEFGVVSCPCLLGYNHLCPLHSSKTYGHIIIEVQSNRHFFLINIFISNHKTTSIDYCGSFSKIKILYLLTMTVNALSNWESMHYSIVMMWSSSQHYMTL